MKTSQIRVNMEQLRFMSSAFSYLDSIVFWLTVWSCCSWARACCSLFICWSLVSICRSKRLNWVRSSYWISCMMMVSERVRASSAPSSLLRKYSFQIWVGLKVLSGCRHSLAGWYQRLLDIVSYNKTLTKVVETLCYICYVILCYDILVWPL